jgi:hypothetical protein
LGFRHLSDHWRDSRLYIHKRIFNIICLAIKTVTIALITQTYVRNSSAAGEVVKVDAFGITLKCLQIESRNEVVFGFAQDSNHP